MTQNCDQLKIMNEIAILIMTILVRTIAYSAVFVSFIVQKTIRMKKICKGLASLNRFGE